MSTAFVSAQWDGQERRIAGNYPGRVALVTDDQQHNTATALVLRSWTHPCPTVLHYRALGSKSARQSADKPSVLPPAIGAIACAAALPIWPQLLYVRTTRRVAGGAATGSSGSANSRRLMYGSIPAGMHARKGSLLA